MEPRGETVDVKATRCQCSLASPIFLVAIDDDERTSLDVRVDVDNALSRLGTPARGRVLAFAQPWSDRPLEIAST
jgi:hypothetical protein